jgi:FkbM family methyltransferase
MEKGRREGNNTYNRNLNMSLPSWQESSVTRVLLRHSICRKIFSAIGDEYILANVKPIKMYLDLRDQWGVSKFILRHGYYDALVSSLMKEWIGPNGNTIDIGANIGYHSLLAAHYSRGQVYAFEPEERNFHLLTHNITLNGYRTITPYRKAVGDRNGSLKLYKSDNNAGDHQAYRTSEHRESVDVEVVRIDDQLDHVQHVAFVKIDVQGFELNVVKGMEQTLRQNHNIKISSEFWPDGMKRAGSSGEEYLKFMESLGFSWYLLDEDKQQLRTMSRNELLDRCTNERAADVFFSRT